MFQQLVFSCLLVFLASTSTVSGECTEPFNDIAKSHYSTWQSKETVCFQAECKANEQKNAKVTRAANKLNKEGGVDQESSGAKMFGDMLAGKEVAPGVYEQYVIDVLGPLIAPGIIFAILNFSFGINAVCSRLICKCLCPRKRCCCTCAPETSRPYTKVETLSPVVTWGVLSLVAFVLAIVGMTAGASAFGNSFIRGSCMVDTTRIRIGGFIDALITPVSKLNSDFDAVVVDVTASLATSGVDSSKATMIENFDSLADATQTYDCSKDLTSKVNAAKDKANGEALELLAVLDVTKNSIQTNLLDSQDTIKSTTDNAEKSADEMKTIINDGLGAASTSAVDAAKQVSNNLDNISITPFLWVYFVVVVASVGIVLMRLCRTNRDIDAGDVKTNPEMVGNVHALNFMGGIGALLIALSWFLAFIFSGVTGAFSAAALPGAQVYTDSCQALIDFPLKLSTSSTTTSSTTTTTTTTDADGNEVTKTDSTTAETSTNSSSEIDMIDGCWKNMSVYTILGMEDALTFQNINFGNIDTLEADLSNAASMDELKTAVEALPEGCESKPNVQAAFETLKDSIANVDKSITDYRDTLVDVEVVSIASLDVSVNKIKLAGACGFLKSTWDETYAILCEEGKSAFSTLGISTMLLAVAGLFIGIALLYVNRRCGGHGPIAASEDNTKISPEDEYDY